MSFFTTAVTGLKTVVTAIGAGVAVWGVINLLEGYGNDNPGAKSQGVKQLMAGGGIVIVAQTVIPQLTSLFSWFMGAIIDRITEFIKEMLQGWVLDNLGTMFTDVNDKVGTIAGEVGQTPSAWNGNIFSMIRSLSDNVMIPIAGLIISAILCYELITMVMDKNNMHEMGSEFFFRYLIKACIAVMLLSKTFDITMAIFDVGNHIVTSAAGVISGSTSIDVTSTLTDMFNNQLSTMGIGELIGLGIETMIVSLCMKIMSVLITVILYGRMIEIYLYISVAPVPFATLSNREWGSIGTNYIRGLCALAFQGFFIMVCVGIYSVLVASVAVAGNLHTALWSVAAYTVILCFSLFKTGSLAKSILHAT